MCKIFFLLVILLALFLWSGHSNRVKAGWICSATNGTHCNETGCYQGCTCDGTNCTDDFAECVDGDCSALPGYYVCNSGTCAIGIPPVIEDDGGGDEWASHFSYQLKVDNLRHFEVRIGWATSPVGLHGDG